MNCMITLFHLVKHSTHCSSLLTIHASVQLIHQLIWAGCVWFDLYRDDIYILKLIVANPQWLHLLDSDVYSSLNYLIVFTILELVANHQCLHLFDSDVYGDAFVNQRIQYPT